MKLQLSQLFDKEYRKMIIKFTLNIWIVTPEETVHSGFVMEEYFIIILG